MRSMMRQKAKRNEKRELSSVGSERLPYKQRVGGSTPSAPTNGKQVLYKANDSFLPCARNASDETAATSAVVRIEDAKHDAAEDNMNEFLKFIFALCKECER